MKKTINRLLSLLLVALLLSPVMAPVTGITAAAYDSVTTVPPGFTGITNATQLNNVRSDLGGKYILMGNITLTGNWTPIGANYTTPFTGVFDGNGYTISGMSVSVNATTGNTVYAGFFGVVLGGEIKNLSVAGSVNATIIGTGNVFAYAGGIVGSLEDGTVINCNSKAAITASSSATQSYIYAGGIAGENYDGKVELCYNNAAVQAMSANIAYAGGLVGSNYGEILQCFNLSPIAANSSGTSSTAGGIAGYSTFDRIANCYNTGPTNATAGSGVGIQTQSLSMGTPYIPIKRPGDEEQESPQITVQAAGDPIAASGGLVGFSDNGTLGTSYNIGARGATGTQSYAGGVVGINYGSGSNVYYVGNPANQAGTGYGNDVFIAARAEQLTRALPGFDAAIWKSINDSQYPFFQLSNLPAPAQTTLNITVQDASETQFIEDAEVSLYVGAERKRSARTGTGASGTIKGIATLDVSGLTWAELQNATISAKKAWPKSVPSNDARYELFKHFPNAERYIYELHSETIDSNGNWCGKTIKKLAENGNALTLTEPRLLVNMAVCYYIAPKMTNTQKDEMKTAVEDRMSELSELLAQTTNGHVYINKILVNKTNARQNYYFQSNETPDIAAMADIRIETSWVDEPSANVHPNANVTGFWLGGTYSVERDEDTNKPVHMNGDYGTIQGDMQFRRIQMGAKWGSGDVYAQLGKKQHDYAATITHEAGHYVLGFLDEYCYGDGYDWDKNGDGIITADEKDKGHWDSKGGISRPSGAPNPYGFMENQYSQIEMSTRAQYSYLPSNFSSMTDREKAFLVTEHYKYYYVEQQLSNASCEGVLAWLLEDGGITTVDSAYLLLDTTHYQAHYSLANNQNQKATYSYAKRNKQTDYIYVPGFSAQSLSEQGIVAQGVNEDLAAPYSKDQLGIVTTTKNGSTLNLQIQPVAAGVPRLYKQDGTAVALTQSGGNYIGTLPYQAGEVYELVLVADVGGAPVANEILVKCAPVNNTGYYYISLDNCVEAALIPQSTTAYTFTANNSRFANGTYKSVNQATYISAENGIQTKQGELYSVAAIYEDLDYSSISWFVRKGSTWTQLVTDFSTEENKNIGARCDFAGDGLYVLMAKEASATPLLPVTNLTYTSDPMTDGMVHVKFNDPNPTANVAYYHIYYSDKAFTAADAEGVHREIVNAGSNSYALRIGEHDATAYIRVVAVGTSGAKSALSNQLFATAPAVDRDGDGIPDWYCDKYNLWSPDGSYKDIANSDDDADGFTNLEEYLMGSDPTDIFSPGLNNIISVASVELDRTDVLIRVGDKLQLTHEISPSGATNKNVTFTSDNTGIATVSATGQVTAVAPGTANITVKTQDGGFEAKCQITVLADDTPPPTTYLVTVNSGTGGGNYAAGATVTITANAAPTGQRFKQWNISPAVGFVDSTSATSATAKFTMPAQAVTATATYEPIPVTTYALSVVSGTGSGNYAAGATVAITANTAPSGKVFDKWIATAGTLANANSANTTFTMPAGAATVTATYKDAPPTPANKTALNNRINEIDNTQKGNYTDATWNAFQNALSDARTVANNASATQAQVDAALNALNAAYAGLRVNQPAKKIFSTKYDATFLNWILFFVCFGWIWMWF